VDRFSVEDSPRYRMAALSRRWLSATEKIYIREFDLILSEWRIVAIVGAEQPINAGAIVDRGLLEKSHISRLVARLVDRGLIGSRIDGKDARKSWLSLTPEGQTIFEGASLVSQERDRLFLSPLDADERRALDGILDKLSAWSDGVL
jgi:DNA-binding MarR family transcriptional regulator